jgi:nitroreductase
MENQILDAMKWRYAIKKFDPSKKLTNEQVEGLMEIVRLSASSFGLQPWHFVVVSNQVIKLKLQEAAFGQAQLADSSHVVIFTHKLNIMTALDDYVASTAANRGVSIDELDGMKKYMTGSLTAKPEPERVPWMARQPYIALGTLLEAAALEKIDVCPMEGFSVDQFNKILGLTEKGLSAVCIATLGYRFADDPVASQPKNRLSAKEAITYIK